MHRRKEASHQHWSNCSFLPLTCHNAVFFRHGATFLLRVVSTANSSVYLGNYMLKTDKSLLAKEICKDMEASLKQRVSVPVIDGGYLLCRDMVWGCLSCWCCTTVCAICWQTLWSVIDHRFWWLLLWAQHKRVHKHQCRAHKLVPDIVVDPVNAYHDQSAFLDNDKNECAFVSLLITSLQSAGYTVHQAPDDANTFSLVQEIR